MCAQDTHNNLYYFVWLTGVRNAVQLTLIWFLTGPNLNGLFGRQSGTTPGYSYSAANKNMAVIWQENTLYDYLLNPKKVIKLVLCHLISQILLHCGVFFFFEKLHCDI